MYTFPESVNEEMSAFGAPTANLVLEEEALAIETDEPKLSLAALSLAVTLYSVHPEEPE